METKYLDNDSIIIAEKIVIGEYCNIGKNVRINVRGTFELGRCSVIQDNCVIECESFKSGEYLFMASNVEVGRGGNTNKDSICNIGNHVGIFENTVINVNSAVTIGNDVGIGADVMIWTHGSWLDITKGFPADFGPVTIGNNVWLPARSIVLPNISIGDNTVIGINSVITKNIPAGCMAAGIPCKVLKENVFPKVLKEDDLQLLISPIINDWKQKILEKNIDTVKHVSYDKDTNCINLVQRDTVIFNITTRAVVGNIDAVAEDLRDYLRRRGIKFFTGLPFKSIKI
jgi:acetyltransferase-like isoleucine patch superfamily enzyme